MSSQGWGLNPTGLVSLKEEEETAGMLHREEGHLRRRWFSTVRRWSSTI